MIDAYLVERFWSENKSNTSFVAFYCLYTFYLAHLEFMYILTVCVCVCVIDAYPVERFWSQNVVHTSLGLYWDSPTIGADLTLEYSLECEPLLIEVSTNQTTVPASVSSVVLTDLHPGTRYNCSIVTTGALGNSEPVSLIILTPEAGEPV